ncbi:MAG: acyltransferase [Acidimicrobiia bacterium]|nr:acyltransferase [Acidimicrobiia bacterium]
MNNAQHVQELVARTPADRNRYVDLLRVFSILVVVVGHWLMAVITIEGDGSVTGDNLLALVPWLQYLTWGLQVMPIFFIVGGFSNLASWESARGKGVAYGTWLRGRMARLLRPTVAFAIVWTALTVVFAHLVRLDPETLEVGLTLVAVPVWFLAVYLLVIPALPLMVALHRRFGALVPVGLIAIAAGIDVLVRDHGMTGIGYVNYVFVWLAVHQLGFFWRERRISGFRTGALLGSVGLGALVVLSQAGLYSRSLLGIPGEEFGNTQPPTIMLMAVALFQLGIILAAERHMRSRLEDGRIWGWVIAANSMAMTVYLWHLPAMAFGVLGAQVSGLGLRGEALTAGWWLSRPFWILILAAMTAPFVRLFAGIERTTPAPPVGSGAAAAVAGSVLAAVGLGLLAFEGFYRPDGFLGLAVVPLALLGTGAGLLGRLRISRAA